MIFFLYFTSLLFLYDSIRSTIVIRTDSLETRAELAVVRTYVENQAILEPILPYRA